ncbi:unnamed protein product [Urochloa decumbens]|uniref:Uncharacterized protein n=1 Tax=Urochloa decumbens TaxID=240449 RepID=A0ABC9ADL1_9POAL
MLPRPEFFSVSSSPSIAVSGDLGFTPQPKSNVVNPATRQWAPLPPQPPPRGGRTMAEGFFADPYLAFDPAVSPHYEVFLMPTITPWAPLDDDAATAGSEWPPVLCQTHVFSSATGHGGRRDNTFRVIKPPMDQNDNEDPPDPYLGKSKRGVYFATLDLNFRLRVWILDESAAHHQMEWVLKHQISNLKHVLASQDSYHQKHDGDCWCFQDINHHANLLEDGEEDDDGQEPVIEPTLIDHSYITLLGFHPFREILYLNSNLSIGLAYDLNTRKVQDLGNMRPKYYHMAGQHEYIRASYPYTPCWMENSFTCST